MKPHPSIFHEALKLVGVGPSEAVMVGDSMTHDIKGAEQVGMQGVLLRRTPVLRPDTSARVPVIRTLEELPGVLCAL